MIWPSVRICQHQENYLDSSGVFDINETKKVLDRSNSDDDDDDDDDEDNDDGGDGDGGNGDGDDDKQIDMGDIAKQLNEIEEKQNNLYDNFKVSMQIKSSLGFFESKPHPQTA